MAERRDKKTSDPILKEIQADIIRFLQEKRLEKGLSCHGLAMRCDIAKSTIKRIEKGAALPSLHVLQTMAMGLGMRVKVSFEPRES